MSLNAFISELQKDGFALNKPYLFDVKFIGGRFKTASYKMINLLCHDATLPGWGATTIPNRIYGYNVEMVSDISMSAVKLNFYVDRSLKMAEMFEEQKESMFNKTNYSPKFRDSYTFDTIISVYDTDNKSVVAEYKLTDCYIKNAVIGALNWATVNTIQSIGVELSYDHYTVKYMSKSSPIQASPKSFMDKLLDNNKFITGTLANNLGSIGALAKSVSPVGLFGNMIPLNFDTVRQIMPEKAADFNAAAASEEDTNPETLSNYVDPDSFSN